MQVKLINITQDAEKLIAKIARVSNPKNQENENISKLLTYCIKHGHWSIFEQATMTVEIITTRAISTQIIRHRSFCFQEFSQRYASVEELGLIEVPDLRTQDKKNRQNSIDNLDPLTKVYYQEKIYQHFQAATQLYNELLSNGVAKECARAILPLNTSTKLYMTGSIRSFITYLQVRTSEETQEEHCEVARAIKEIFIKELPIISGALNWI